MNEILIAALKSFIIPEILTAIRAHKNATGREPTSEEILAVLDLDAKRIKDVGQLYLDATRMPPATNG